MLLSCFLQLFDSNETFVFIQWTAIVHCLGKVLSYENKATFVVYIVLHSLYEMTVMTITGRNRKKP